MENLPVMKFSIITITYNSEKYLRETLSSVAKQTFDSFEHILWDGGSTDKTLDIAKEYPHLIIKKGNDTGISDAMNKGAKFACGDFLLHLHSDDMLASKHTLEQVSTFLKQRPTLQWVYGKAHFIDGSGKTHKTTDYIPFSSRRLRKYNIITHPSTFISKTLFEKSGGFSTDIRYCMDYEMCSVS